LAKKAGSVLNEAFIFVSRSLGFDSIVLRRNSLLTLFKQKKLKKQLKLLFPLLLAIQQSMHRISDKGILTNSEFP